MPIISMYLLFCMVMTILVDMTRYTIPNWLVGSMLVLYPIAVFLAPGTIDWYSGLQAMGIAFAVGYIIFVMRWMGGGDVKLIIVCCLWIGMKHIVDFLFLMTLLGGLLSLALLMGRKLLVFALVRQKIEALPRILQEGAPVPYGLAIATAFLYCMWMGQVSATSLRALHF